VVLLLYLLLPL